MMRDALRKLDLMTVNREPALYLGSSAALDRYSRGFAGHVARPTRSIRARLRRGEPITANKSRQLFNCSTFFSCSIFLSC